MPPRRRSPASRSSSRRTGVREETAERVRRMFNFRRERFRSRFDLETDGAIEDQSVSYQRLLRELLDAEREAVLDLQRSGRIDDQVLRRGATSTSRKRG